MNTPMVINITPINNPGVNIWKVASYPNDIAVILCISSWKKTAGEVASNAILKFSRLNLEYDIVLLEKLGVKIYAIPIIRIMKLIISVSVIIIFCRLISCD